MESKKSKASKAFLLYGALELDTEDSYGFLKKIATETKENITSMLAVRDTLKSLEATGESECAEAVRYIYISQRKTSPASMDISMTVQKFATEQYLDERTVYRRLKKASDLYLSFVKNTVQ